MALHPNNILSNTSREEDEIPEEKGRHEQSSIKHESSIKMHDKRKSFAAMSDQDDQVPSGVHRIIDHNMVGSRKSPIAFAKANTHEMQETNADRQRNYLAVNRPQESQTSERQKIKPNFQNTGDKEIQNEINRISNTIMNKKRSRNDSPTERNLGDTINS